MFTARHLRVAPLVLVFLAGVWNVSASAQVAESTLGGRVVDAAGRGVPEARVFARRDGTKVRRTTTADAEGFYLFPPLPAGDWDVEASAEGHTVAIVGDVLLSAAHSRRLDLELEPAEAQEMVTFVDYPPLTRQDAGLGLALDSWELEDLPLRRRSLDEVRTLAPLPVDPATDHVRVDGGRVPASLAGAFGVPLVGVRGAELRFDPAGAEFGGAGAVVSLVTGSGGRERRGAAFVLHGDESLAGSFSEAHASETRLGVAHGGPLGRQTSRRGLHVFGAAEAAEETGTDVVLRLDRHDPRQLLRLRFLRSDPEERKPYDSLLGAWQTQISSQLWHDLRVQVDAADEAAFFGAAVGGRVRSLQVRSDLHLARPSGPGLHDLAFGVESLDRSLPEGDADAWSLYVRDRWWVGDRLRLMGGVRADLFDATAVDGTVRRDRVSPRTGLVWRLDDGGSQLLRAAAGRFFDPLRGLESDRMSLGWSWQLGPFLGLSLDGVTVETAASDAALDHDAATLTVRSRFGDTFQVRASYSRLEPETEASAQAAQAPTQALDRTVVTGLYRAPAEVLVAVVYRSASLGRFAGPGIDPTADGSGFDLRLAKGLAAGAATVEILAEVFDVFEEQSDGARFGRLGLRLSF